MTHEDLLYAIGEIGEKTAMEAERETRTHRMNGKRLLALAAAVALLLSGAVGALAASSESVNDLLYRVWPWAAQALKPVNLSCEDQGIRMEVESAVLRGNEALVTLTMRDMTGDRLDETMDLFDSEALHLPYDGSGTCALLNFDAETRTASFAVYMKFDMDGSPAESDKVTFSVSQFLTKKRHVTVDLTPLLGEIRAADTVPVPGRIRGGGGSGALSGNEKNAVKVLNPENSLEIPVTEGVTLCGAGIADGVLHVQMRYDDIFHTDNHGFLTLSDADGKEYGHGELPDGIGSVSWFGRETNGDSWEEYLFTDYPENLENMALTGEFWTADPAVEGCWQVTFPLKNIQE